MKGRQTLSDLDALGVHEAVVDGVDGVILADVAVALKQDGTSVEAIVSPEDAEPASLVALDKSPTEVWFCTITIAILTF